MKTGLVILGLLLLAVAATQLPIEEGCIVCALIVLAIITVIALSGK